MCSAQKYRNSLPNFGVIALSLYLHFELCPGHNSDKKRFEQETLLVDRYHWVDEQ
jgi:hypothetical protein